MLSRTLLVAVAGLGLSACASEITPSAGFGPTGSIAPAAVGARAMTAQVASDGLPAELPKKTMSDRVLTAIALERVTGLKPDPARLAQP